MRWVWVLSSDWGCLGAVQRGSQGGGMCVHTEKHIRKSEWEGGAHQPGLSIQHPDHLCT